MEQRRAHLLREVVNVQLHDHHTADDASNETCDDDENVATSIGSDDNTDDDENVATGNRITHSLDNDIMGDDIVVAPVFAVEPAMRSASDSQASMSLSVDNTGGSLAGSVPSVEFVELVLEPPLQGDTERESLESPASNDSATSNPESENSFVAMLGDIQDGLRPMAGEMHEVMGEIGEDFVGPIRDTGAGVVGGIVEIGGGIRGGVNVLDWRALLTGGCQRSVDRAPMPNEFGVLRPAANVPVQPNINISDGLNA